MRYNRIDTVIVSGGNVERDFALDFLKKIEKEKGSRPYLIAADRGMDFFAQADITPDLVVGDFDSVSEIGKTFLDSGRQMEIIKLKPEKDDSDTQSAVNTAVRRGAKNILLLGCTGTRLDHIMANLGLLIWGKEQGIHIAIVDRHNYVCMIESGTVLKAESQFGKYVSFFPAGGDVKGLTLGGFKYPLVNHHLRFSDSGLTVSNEIIEEGIVTYTEGTLLMIMSDD